MHSEVQHKINVKHEAALKTILFRIWVVSGPKVRKKIERMLGVTKAGIHKVKHRKKGSSHTGKHYKKKGKMSKAAARARFKKLLPKINAGRKKAGLKPIRIK